MLLLQYLLVLIKAYFADVEKQLGADILIRSLELCEFLQSIALRLEVVDKGADQKGQPCNVFALLRFDQLFINFRRRAFVQFITARNKLFVQMKQIIPTVGILRVGIYQIGLVLRVHLLFVVDSRNIFLQLLLRITITSVIFGYPEMFDIRNLVALFYAEVGRIGFVRIENRILIYRLVLVFYLIHI